MRISTRIALGLTILGIALFGVYGWWMLDAEKHDLHLAIQREMRLLGRTLQVAAGNTLRAKQVQEAQAMLERLETIDPHLTVMVLAADGRILLSTRAMVVDDLIREVVREVGARVRRGVLPPDDRVLRYDDEEDPSRIVTGLPLTTGDDAAYLLVIRKLDEVHRDLEATRTGVSLSFGLFVAVVWVLSVLLGTLYLGRPLSRLAAAMRQVRSGDLGSGVQISGRDEISEVALAFNDMVADLRSARQALEEAAEARGRDQRALQEADKLVTIGQLSAGLAHEIGSPLQVLAGRARALQSRAGDADEVRRISAILVEQAARIARIVEQLLQYARRRPARVAPVHLPEVVRTVTDLLTVEASRRGVALQVAEAPDLPVIQADGDQLQQLVLNLVNNAMQACARGGRVVVEVRCDRDSAPQEVLVSVRDNGRGIPDAIRDKLFDPFFSTRTAEGGTGLGLAVVRSIVTEHRGRIAVSSEVGIGTTVTVHLPTSEHVTLAHALPAQLSSALPPADKEHAHD